jgi:PAT family beta-lactamase induction signal transducer AmpG
MRLPNLLATRRGRLAAFFVLYITEGIPLGFAAIAIATQLRRQGVGPETIGAFIGLLYIPWAFKWAFGPVVDLLGWEQVGRRRGWIILTQLLMASILAASIFLRLPEQLALFTAIVFLHSLLGATQDVAIDALACGTLHEDERGAANGLMFAGAYLGQAIGGAGVLYLADVVGFQPTFLVVAGCTLCVTIFVVLPMREPPGPARPRREGSLAASLAGELRRFAADSFRSMLGSRGAFVGLFIALLPAGAMALGLALFTNLAVELRLADSTIATLTLSATIVSALLCVAGGFLSDRLGRRQLYALGVILAGVPALVLMFALLQAGWVMPVPLDDPSPPPVPAWLVTIFWVTVLAYAAVSGLIYGVRSAMFMDVTNPLVAATQFTAYMALLNATISYTAIWQGIAIASIGYPRTLLIDALLGLACLALIPFMRKVRAGETVDSAAPRRARALALGLAVALLASPPMHLIRGQFGASAPVLSMFMTLGFVAAAVFLGAGGALLARRSPLAARLGLWVAPLLFALAGRNFVEPVGRTLAEWTGADGLSEALARAVEFGMWSVPLLGAGILLRFAADRWSDLTSAPRTTRPDAA